jgi:hypothetical protein
MNSPSEFLVSKAFSVDMAPLAALGWLWRRNMQPVLCYVTINLLSHASGSCFQLLHHYWYELNASGFRPNSASQIHQRKSSTGVKWCTPWAGSRIGIIKLFEETILSIIVYFQNIFQSFFQVLRERSSLHIAKSVADTTTSKLSVTTRVPFAMALRISAFGHMLMWLWYW